MSRYRVGIDIGGTFTDFVVMDNRERSVLTGKSLTTTEDRSLAVINTLRELVPSGQDVDFIVHGTTAGLNALLERKGDRVVLISTGGLRDSYTIARGDRKEIWRLQYHKPQGIVARRDVVEVRERLRWDGSVAEPLHEEDLAPIIDRLKQEGIRAVAVCFIHAFVNPAHELRVREVLRAALPDLSITLSHEIAQEWREYERASSATLNAYIDPIVGSYLKRLEDRLDDYGCKRTLHVMQSNGGVITAATAKATPVQTLLSGPVGGVIGCVALSAQSGRPNLLCVDMGGTSFDMSLVVDGQPRVSSETELEGLPILMTLIDIRTIGAGGGSIAWLETGALRVGPQSAGANPGPACYGQGGAQPTVTDANLVLKRLDPGFFLGGRMALDEGAAARVVRDMAQSLGSTEVALAEGILAIVNAKMADAMRTITIKQGLDPREYALVAYGGAGPMHAVWLAEELEIPEVIVPWSPGTLSAWGMLQTDLRHDRTRTFYHRVAVSRSEDIAAAFAQLETAGMAFMTGEGVLEDDVYFRRSADMRYVGQEYVVNVPVVDDVDLGVLEADFHDAHGVRYGHSTPAAAVEFVNLRSAVFGKLDRLQTSPPPPEAGDPLAGTREVIFDGRSIPTRILLRSRLAEGAEHAGPLIVEEETATTVVPPGYIARIDKHRNIVISRGSL